MSIPHIIPKRKILLKFNNVHRVDKYRIGPVHNDKEFESKHKNPKIPKKKKKKKLEFWLKLEKWHTCSLLDAERSFLKRMHGKKV